MLEVEIRKHTAATNDADPLTPCDIIPPSPSLTPSPTSTTRASSSALSLFSPSALRWPSVRQLWLRAHPLFDVCSQLGLAALIEAEEEEDEGDGGEELMGRSAGSYSASFIRNLKQVCG